VTSKRRQKPLGNNEDVPSATLAMRIQPRASKNEIVPMANGGLKIRLTAPPVDGAANQALIAFLALKLNVSKSQVQIVSGHTGREKIIRISGMDGTDARRLLNIADE